MNEVVVVIPIYKEHIPNNEKMSLRQCLKVLSKYDICFITFHELNLKEYVSILNEFHLKIKVIYFDKQYFLNINGYNKLCLTKEFYRSFFEYKFMLIYQLDTWVFRDELMDWCAKDYDYIGAPWFEGYGTHEEGNKLWEVGNGGLSLRKIKYFIKVLSWKLPLIRPKFKRIFSIHFLLYYLGRHNTINYFQQHSGNEDYFFSQVLKDSWFPPVKPDCKEASLFSFERSPSYLYQINGNKLPFGCHAYFKNEFETFWKKFIQ